MHWTVCEKWHLIVIENAAENQFVSLNQISVDAPVVADFSIQYLLFNLSQLLVLPDLIWFFLQLLNNSSGVKLFS